MGAAARLVGATSERVVRRYLVRLALYQTRIAAQIPGAWFKGKAAELKALLKEPLNGSLQHWSDKVEASLTGFFDAFERDFARVAPSHADAVAPAVREAKRSLRLALIPWWDLESFRSLYVFNPDGHGIAEELRHAAGWACVDRVETSVKTVGDLFKITFSVSHADISAAVQKVLSKSKPAATQSDLVAAVRTLAPKAVVKAKASWSPAGWVDKAFNSLSEAWAPEPFTTFDVGGLRVVFDGTVPDKDVEHYMKDVVAAHRALTKKRLRKAWYGTLHICPGCDDNAGGVYRPGPDTVSVYVKPGVAAVYAIVHELGHRYWFKNMSQGQRARFQTLVKAHTVRQPYAAPRHLQVMLFTKQDIRGGHLAVDRFAERFHHLFDKLESSTNPDGIARAMRAAIEGLQKNLRRFISLVGDSKVLSGPAIDLHNDFSVPLAHARMALEKAIDDADHAAIDRHAIEVVTRAHAWVDAAAATFNAIADAEVSGLEGGREWLDSYLDNPAPVVPVSAYGKTNIDEAFAEVFAHYVLEFDITRDQLESFRSVLER